MQGPQTYTEVHSIWGIVPNPLALHYFYRIYPLFSQTSDILGTLGFLGVSSTEFCWCFLHMVFGLMINMLKIDLTLTKKLLNDVGFITQGTLVFSWGIMQSVLYSDARIGIVLYIFVEPSKFIQYSLWIF